MADRSRRRRGSLAVAHPLLARQWHPTKNGTLTPADVTAGSHQRVWWRCEGGHEWIATVQDRTQKGSGCPHCYNQTRGVLRRKAVVKRRGSLAATKPELASQWHPYKNGELTPKEVPQGSPQRVWWLCLNGHEWKTAVGQRVGSGRQKGSGCPTCYKNNRRKVKGDNVAR